MPEISGGCLCGEIRYRVTGDSVFSAICHCPSCRHASGAPLVAWALFSQSDLTIDSGSPAVFASSPGVQRSFCSACGTPLLYESTNLPGLVDITVFSFDDPAAFDIQSQIWTRHETACIGALSGMTRYDALPEFGPDETKT